MGERRVIELGALIALPQKIADENQRGLLDVRCFFRDIGQRAAHDLLFRPRRLIDDGDGRSFRIAARDQFRADPRNHGDAQKQRHTGAMRRQRAQVFAFRHGRSARHARDDDSLADLGGGVLRRDGRRRAAERADAGHDLIGQPKFI